MTEKIEWYKEVLEVEPNSKVFFPLARMLANEGAVEEAIGIIEKGLVRHPEFLEARLYCIELLHKCGRIEDSKAHVELLSKMFSAYGEFWRAWASCIATMRESGSEDTASALRFLAANFLHGPVSLNKVIEEGLAVILEENRQKASTAQEPLSTSPENIGEPSAPLLSEDVAAEAIPDVPAPTAVEEPTEEPAQKAAPLEDDFTGMAEAMPAASDLPVMEEPAEETVQEAAPLEDDLTGMAEAMPAASDLPVMEEPAEETVQEAAPLEDDLTGMAEAMPAASDLPVMEEPAEETVQEAAPLEDDLTGMAEAMPAASDLPVVEEPVEEPAQETASIEDEEHAFAPSADTADENDALFAGMEVDEGAAADLDLVLAKELSAEELPDASDTPLMHDMTDLSTPEGDAAPKMREAFPAEDAHQETFSIRTRSMAEVLAEQGDIQGALEIYQELEQAADGFEKNELAQRIITLQARLGGSVPTPAVEEIPAKAPTGKEQVLSVLTSLAKALENRAH